MPLETATTITDLVTSNPAHTDGLSQADSHMRLIKSTLKNTFPNFPAATAVQSTPAQIDAASTGLVPSRFFAGTAALPGFTPVGTPSTGFWSPAANQVAFSISGVQALLMGGTALVTTMSITSTSGIAGAAIASVGAYSGGTGQLVPIGSTLLWWDDVLPTEGGYVWANGSVYSAASAPTLFARWGSRFGGNGTTTFGVPDLRDTVPVGKSTMGGASARGLITNWTNTVLNTVIGVMNTVLVAANLPPYTPAGTIVNGAITTLSTAALAAYATGGGGNNVGGGGSIGNFATNSFTSSQATSFFVGIAQGGTSAAFNNVQPSTTCNYIIRFA